MAQHAAAVALALVLLPMCLSAPFAHLHQHHGNSLLTTPGALVQQRSVSTRALLAPGTYNVVQGARCQVTVTLSFEGSALPRKFYKCWDGSVIATAVPKSIKPYKSSGRRLLAAAPSSVSELNQDVKNAPKGLSGVVGTAFRVTGSRRGNVTVTATVFFATCKAAARASSKLPGRFAGIVPGGVAAAGSAVPAAIPGKSGSSSQTCSADKPTQCKSNKTPVKRWFYQGKEGGKDKYCKCAKLCKYFSNSLGSKLSKSCYSSFNSCVTV